MEPVPALLPLPRQMTVSGAAPLQVGRLQLSGAIGNPLVAQAGARAAEFVARHNPQGAAELNLEIHCANTQAQYPEFGADESYRLHIEQGRGLLEAPTVWGVLQGLTTLQLLCVQATGLPACQIDDAPRFPWRGLMLDPARHFLPLPTLLETIDGMSLCKLNVLHLHLSDDQGFRFPSSRFPKLPSAECYTRSELAQLVEYAAARGIRVVPELDVPGHSTSWLVGYPHWGKQNSVTATTRFGVHKACLNVADPAVHAAILELLDELGEVFVDTHVHIGGDEVNPKWWLADDNIEVEPAVLQAQFNQSLHAHLVRRGKRMMGWDEVLHAQFAASTADCIVQSWRGASARDRAIAAGFDVVDSSGYYLDLMYPASVHYAADPAAPLNQRIAAEDALLDQPRFAHVADGMRWTEQWRQIESLPPVSAPGRVLGGEACLWGELVDARTLPLRLWSRLPAVAERLWSPAAATDFDSLYERMANFSALLEIPGAVEHWRELGLDPSLDAFLELLEPVKWYARLLGPQALQARLMGQEMPQARPYSTNSELNRLVDYLPPESLVARRLSAALDSAALSRELDRWDSAAASAHCPEDLVSIAQDLRQAIAIVRSVITGVVSAPEAVPQLQALSEPQGEYMLAVVQPLVGWVRARAAS